MNKDLFLYNQQKQRELFEKAKDKYELRKQMPEFDFELDTEFDCYCNNV